MPTTSTSRKLIPLALAAAGGLALLLWGYGRAFPFVARALPISERQAIQSIEARLRAAGEPVRDPFVIARISQDSLLERRLQLAAEKEPLARLRATGLPDRMQVWQVEIYRPDALKGDTAIRGELTFGGALVSLHVHVDADAKRQAVPPAVARAVAERFLRQEGVALDRYGEPEIRTQQLLVRTDTTLRYRHRDRLADGSGFGFEVKLAGDRVSDYGPWIDEGASAKAVQRSLQSTQVLLFGRLALAMALLVMLAFPFLKRYHEGEIGVRRGAELFLLTGFASLLLILMVAHASAEEVGLAFATPRQAIWLYTLFGCLFTVLPRGLLAFLAWSVGEALSRERWGQKLTSFDALFQRKWANATVAASSLAGVLAGLAIAGLSVGLLILLRPLGVWPNEALSRSLDSGWTGLELAMALIGLILPLELTVALCVLPTAMKRLGPVPGFLVAALASLLLLSQPVLALPVGWGMVLCYLVTCALLAVWVGFDLLAFLLACATSDYLIICLPLLHAGSPALRWMGWGGLVLVTLPLWLSLRYLGSRREISYSYEDVPPHVRRIADRERQRVELETARRIQSSILPDLPARLAGIELAHAYLPASEVGGDFYDVLALEDGRLALAIGDVAGHGVSSGLVMAMAKSALAVQVTFDPEVASVFETLNRTVYQTARKRLLATFCYALLDPLRRELRYASAGHLYPYRISLDGRVEELRANGYPLGVRRGISVEPRTVRLDAGDALFLFSDGLVEARALGSDELFGFDRLEQSLVRHAREGVEQMRDLVLADVAAFTRHAPREDDMTVVVARLPGLPVR